MIFQIALLSVCLEIIHSSSSCGDGRECGPVNDGIGSDCFEQIVTTSSTNSWRFGEDSIGLTSAIAKNDCDSKERTLEQLGSSSSPSIYNITSIGVSSANQLVLTSQIYTNTNNKVRLSFSLLDEVTRCKVYDIQPIGNYLHANLLDSCLTALETNKVYNLNVTTPQSSTFQRIYRFFTSSSIVADEGIGQGDKWKSVIAVTVHSDVITVFTQPIPGSSTYKYRIQLVFNKGEFVQLEESEDKYLEAGQPSVSFNRLSDPDLFYTIKLSRCALYAGHPDVNQCSLIQEHNFQAEDIATYQEMSADQMDTDPDQQVVIKETNSGLHNQDLYILLGTIFGVVFLVIVIAIGIFLYLKRRNGLHHGLTARFTGGNVYSDGLLCEEDIKGSPPTVLLLYSYDCQAHLACVQSFALLLQNALGCTVMADFWATQEIAERGIHLWLQHKLATVQYVIVVCSTGARFKSVINRRAQFEQETDDAFISAMNLLQNRSDFGGHQKIAVFFDYSCESDIPVLLENWQRYKVMKDIPLLVPTIVDCCSKDRTSPWKSDHEQVYLDTLEEKLNLAKKYMTENPDWFHANLQAQKPDSSPASSTPSPVFSRGSQPLEVVTVERNRNRTVSDCSQSSDMCDQPDSRKRSRRHLSRHKETSLQTLPVFKTTDDTKRCKVESGFSSLDSYSSSLEDLEQDIDFILNPSLPTKTKFMSSPQGLVDILPTFITPGLQSSSISNGLVLTVPLADIEANSIRNHSTSSWDESSDSADGSVN